MPELLSLAELKKRAKAAVYTKISRLGDAGSAVPLDSWDAVTADAASVFADADISYILNGNAVKRARVTSSTVCPTFCPDLKVF
jgi:hypothetical protein